MVEIWHGLFSNQIEDFILNQIHLMDILHEISNGAVSTSLDRYVQIDIDDMFVGSEVKLTALLQNIEQRQIF